MNIRNVLRTYSLLRQLNDDESALLETLRNATEAERELLVETLSPQKPTTKRAGKKSASKSNIPLCGACGYAESSIVHKDESRSNFHPFYPPSKSASKSSRASGMAAAINRSLRQRASDIDNSAVALDGERYPTDGNDPNDHCQKVFPGGFICDEPADANVHHLRGATGYHEFDSGKSLALRVGAKSSTNGGASDDEQVSVASGDQP